MNALLLKEFYLFRNNSKQLFLMLLLFLIIGITTESTVYFSTISIVFCLQIMTSFSYDQYGNWTSYVLSLPLSRKKYVASKYIFSFYCCLTGGLFCLMAYGIYGLIKESGDWREIFLLAGGIFVMGILLSAVLIPILLKFGAEKSRIIFYIVFGVLFGIFFVFAKNPDLAQFVQMIMKKSTWVIGSMTIAGTMILLILISFSISVKIFKEKEF